MDGAFPTKACLKRAIDSMFEPNPDFLKFLKTLKKKEVRKEMAIDYREEWKELSSKCGAFGVNIPHEAVSVSLRSIMENQIADTIESREKLMEEYVKSERITTDISGGERHFYHVSVIDGRTHWLIGTIHVHKADFRNWLKREKRKEVK